ncbi:MAG: hypothetical protein QE486_09025 [Burkholderiaceae bacterium]|nr:hypothetical protein [Burkholderiaceae bacterium]
MRKQSRQSTKDTEERYGKDVTRRLLRRAMLRRNIFEADLATQSIPLTGLKPVGHSLAYLIDLTLDGLFLLGLE